MTQPITLRLTSTTGPPARAATTIRLRKPMRGSSITALLRRAALQVSQPITLRLTSTTGPPASGARREEFRAAMRALKRTQRLIRQSESLLRHAGHEATRRTAKPVRRSPFTSRAALWRWYRARGLSWARFVADHGVS